MSSELELALNNEIAQHCEFVLLAFEDLVRLVKNRRGPATAGDIGLQMARTWMPLQTIVVSAANIDKLLWGGQLRDAELRAHLDRARKRLRHALQVDETSPLRQREVRHGFEHYDEKLADWLRSDPYFVASRNIDSVIPSKQLGHFHTPSGTLVFLDAAINIREFAQEVRRVYARTRWGYKGGLYGTPPENWPPLAPWPDARA